MIGGGTPEPPKPQYYQVSCAEGHVIRGERTEGYQALRCPHCGDGVFVLPRSPLPLPPAPPSARPKPKPTRVEPEYEDAGIELTEAPPQEELESIQWMDEPEPLAPSPVAPSPRAQPRADSRADVATEPEAPAPIIPPRPKAKPQARKAPQGAPGTAPRPSPRAEDATASPAARGDGLLPGQILVPVRPRKDRRLAFVLGAVAILAVGAYAYRQRSLRLQELPHEAEVNALEGREALEQGRFDEAKIKLGKAAKAYRDLNASDELASQTQQFAEEAAIYADHLRIGHKELVDEVAGLGDPEGIERFQVLYKGKGVIIDDVIESVTPVPVVVSRILVGPGPVPARKGRWDLSGFKLLQKLDLKKGDQVLFGARLDSIRLEGDQWLITLQPDSGVLLTNAKAKAIAELKENPPS